MALGFIRQEKSDLEYTPELADIIMRGVKATIQGLTDIKEEEED